MKVCISCFEEFDYLGYTGLLLPTGLSLFIVAWFRVVGIKLFTLESFSSYFQNWYLYILDSIYIEL